MKRLLMTGLAVGTLAAAAPAAAATFTLSNYTVSLHDTDPGLVVYASDPVTTPYAFNLAGIGDSHTVALFRLGTRESDVSWFDGEDTADHPISVFFQFSTPGPPFSGTATGLTDGFVQFNFSSCSVFAGGCGRVSWDNPTLLNFGDSGVLSIFLTPRTFTTPGSARIDATFTWQEGVIGEGDGDQNTQAVIPRVPEPATLTALGIGLTAVASRIRKNIKTRTRI